MRGSLRRIATAVGVIALSGSFAPGCAEMDPAILNNVLAAATGTGGGALGLDESTVVAGLKQALEVGTKRTVASTSRSDGFLLNKLIRIETPEQLQPMASALRAIGFGSQVDQLETAMNRAAERASGEATDIFWNEISRMSIQDAFGILNGGQTAATDYFRERTSTSLANRFRPIVNEKMQEVGLYQTYQSLTQAYAALPLTTKPALDMEKYVTDQAVSGIFSVLATEETRIREDPAARSTELLKRVFANAR